MSENQRLLSLDFFRGFTIAGMILVNNPGDWSHIYAPLQHADWHGCTPTDLVFPFFLFIVGVSITLAFSKSMARHVPRPELYKKIVRRTLILFALGLFLSGFPTYDLASIRIPGVLQRIAVCYFFAAVIFLNSSPKTQLGWAIAFMLVYWAFMEWFPVPAIGAGHYEKGANFSAYIDQLLLDGHLWSQTKTWDPEGVFSTLPAISTTLFGVLTGHLILRQMPAMRKFWLMMISGAIATLIGWVWHQYLPINKSIWTSSYALYTAGIALMTLGACYFLVDIKGWQRATKPFVIYGMNAITVYVLSGIIARTVHLIKWQSGDEVINVKVWMMNTLFLPWLSPINASLAYALCFVLVTYLAMYYLYKKQIFIKV